MYAESGFGILPFPFSCEIPRHFEIISLQLQLCNDDNNKAKKIDENSIVLISFQWKMKAKSYLGSTLSRNIVFDDEVNAGLAKASTTLGRLHKNV